ncbi:MAG: hypothetical protein RIR18_65 [Pseudomonadota bacterium]|jgi:predicted neuraminidase
MKLAFREPEWHAFLAFAVFLMVLGLSLLTQPKLSQPQFLPAATSPETAAQKPWMKREFLPIAAPSVHAPTLTELPDGRIAAAWFAGSREGADDVRIVMSLRGESPIDEEAQAQTTQTHSKPKAAVAPLRWQPPRTIANREQTVRDTRRSIRKLGNPVLFVDDQRLHLFYVSASLGGWAGSSINHRYSDDQGEHWSTATKLITSPFLNVSTLARTPPLKLTDGSIGLPVYHELFHKHGEWLRISPQGDVISKTRMPHSRHTLQPSVVSLDSQRAIALLRDAGAGKGHIQISTTEDGGQHWLPGPALPLTNPNSSIAALRLQDGRFLLAANPGEGRHILDLWVAPAPNREQPLTLRWEKVTTIDTPTSLSATETGQNTITATLNASGGGSGGVNGSGPAITDESSYPALLQTRDGLIHLAYTWHRQRIQIVSFNLAWLDANKSDQQTKHHGKQRTGKAG